MASVWNNQGWISCEYDFTDKVTLHFRGKKGTVSTCLPVFLGCALHKVPITPDATENVSVLFSNTYTWPNQSILWISGKL